MSDKPMGMVERVAAALYGDFLDNAHPTDAAILRKEARLAISAMREPTEGMRLAGQDKCDDYLDAAECWPAMIDAALTESK